MPRQREPELGPHPDWWDLEGALVWETPDDRGTLEWLATQFNSPPQRLKGRLAVWVDQRLLDVDHQGVYSLPPLKEATIDNPVR